MNRRLLNSIHLSYYRQVISCQAAKIKVRWLLMAIMIFCIMLNRASAQTDEWVWAQSAGGIFNEARGERVVTDHSGHVIVAGTYSCPEITFGGTTLQNNGGDDLFLVKMDTAGNVLWATGAGGDYAEEGYTVATDDAGYVYLAGEFWSSSVTFGSYTITNSGSADLFLVKYDAQGNVLWAKSASGPDEDRVYAIAADPMGNIYITGSYISNTLNFGGISVSNSQPNTEDMFVAKYDADGNVMWAKDASGLGNDKGFGIAADADGQVVVSGHFISNTLNFGSQSLLNSGGFDIFLVKYDENGDVIWAVNPSGSGYDFNFSMEMDESGYVYLTGHFSSFQLTFGSSTLTNGGGDDIYVAKYDADGNALWAQKAGGITYDYGYDVSVDGNGQVFLTGNFQSPVISFGSITLINSTTYADMYVVKYSADGDPQWAINGAGSDYTFGRGCGADPSGNIYVTGLFGNETLTLGSITLTTFAGYSDMFIGRYGNSNCSNVYYADADNDTYGNSAVSIVACTAPAGYVADSTDCDDSDPDIYAPSIWFLDADGDLYGQPEINLAIACTQPAGYVSNNEDCDDTNAAINPGETEIPGNGIDDDCDGMVDETTTGIVSVTDYDDVFVVWPNPTLGHLNIQLNLGNGRNGDTEIMLHNLLGQEITGQVTKIKEGALKTSLDMPESLQQGMYLLSVTVIDQNVQEEVRYLKWIMYQQ